MNNDVESKLDSDIEWSDSESSAVVLEGSLRNILEQESLRWVFVGGKGGVGKTTTSCSLAVALSKVRKSVLLISTDPAHNLSDAFGQKFGRKATKVDGFDNLHAMEIDPTVELESSDALDSVSKTLISELASSIPGIDEAMSFAELMKQVKAMQYDTIVFDTAPTGHTLRLLSFPSVIERAVEKMLTLKSKFQGMFAQMQSMIAETGTSEAEVLSKFEQAKAIVDEVNKQFKDVNRTTFVCVCIPEFLSLYETERLVQELNKYEIDSHNIVVNQVLMVEDGECCKKCTARQRMQRKYLNQITDLYEDFHVTILPLLDEEVRGRDCLDVFRQLIINPPTFDVSTGIISSALPKPTPRQNNTSSSQ
eukprot:TRINITY_DN114497_c0_g1_i1.p1 TRINITY_DN114497_c0_g1~~TRINITY_DN114497_c0_g1_i1.p1  ORF type:complete len:364 (-),score=185.73 TRINITY_DN114497_c0_g1_i1:323-1414(-)